MKRSALTPLVILALGTGTPPAAAQDAGMQDVMNLPRPIEALDNVWIEELTMMEVRDALAEGKNTVLILTGGIEENGPYLTTGSQRYLYRIEGDRAAKIAVTFGQVEGNVVEVLTGVQAGDLIIVSGYQNFIEHDIVVLEGSDG